MKIGPPKKILRVLFLFRGGLRGQLPFSSLSNLEDAFTWVFEDLSHRLSVVFQRREDIPDLFLYQDLVAPLSLLLAPAAMRYCSMLRFSSQESEVMLLQSSEPPTCVFFYMCRPSFPPHKGEPSVF